MRSPNLTVFAILLVAALFAACTTETDLIVRGATLVDGTGAAPRTADIAIRDGRVSSIGELEGVSAAREIDATGLIAAPGFVDIHSHADLILLGDRATQERLLSAKIRQGVTTIVVGNCGLGVAPASGDAASILAGINGWMTPDDVRPGPSGVGEYLDRLERGGVALNVGTLVPHGPVRISEIGLSDGEAAPPQLERMRGAVARGLDEGAFGLSTGLIYPPGMYSPTGELIALAEEVAARDRLFTAHVRGSSETLIRATGELLEIARRTGARTHHSHLEAVGEPFWPDVRQVLELEQQAAAEGVRITHDVFLYTRAATMMAAIFPPWSLEGGVDALLERLRDPATREKIRLDIETRTPEWPPWQPGGWPHNLVGAVGWDGILVASVGPGGPADWTGSSLAEIGRAQGRGPFDVVADLMVSQQGQVGQLVDQISGQDDRIDVLLSIMTHPHAAIVSDAEDYGRGSPHPAHAGAFPRALRLNRERKLMSLQELVRRMTSHPASIIGLDDRGVLRLDAPADLVLFDPLTVTDRATWQEPRKPADGIRWVLINGRIVVVDGEYHGGLPGHVLRAPL